MRILVVTPFYPPAYEYGGPARIAEQLARALYARGHTVTVVTTDTFGAERGTFYDGDYRTPLVRGYRNVSNGLAYRHRLFLPPGMAFGLRRWVRKADVVHIHEYRNLPAVFACIWCWAYGRPYVIQPHGSLERIGKPGIKRVFDRLIGRRMLRCARRVLALTEAEGGQASVNGARWSLLPNFVDDAELLRPCPISGPDGRHDWEYGPESVAAKRVFVDKRFVGCECGAVWCTQCRRSVDPAEAHECGIPYVRRNAPAGKQVILFLGRLNRIKGPDLLLDAYVRLRSGGYGQDTVLVFAGPDEGAEKYLRYAAARSKLLGDSIRFPGFLNAMEKRQALTEARVLVLPSRREMFPLTLLEAVAAGTSVIRSTAFRVSGLGAAEGVYVFPAGDVRALVECLRRVLDDPYPRAAVRRGQAVVRDRYSRESVVSALERLFYRTFKLP